MNSTAQIKLNYLVALAEWLLDNGDDYFARGEAEHALRCNHLAAYVLTAQNRFLTHPRIEANLQRFAALLPPPQEASALQRDKRPVCLHVLDEALPLGGHTAMSVRWMNNDPGDYVHSVALLSQQVPVPEVMAAAVQARGGQVYTVNPGDSFLSRAKWLRNLAREMATRVVLHINPDDLIAGVAFGSPGGPPVMLVNHAAHLYWAGASITDLVLNCRGSALEAEWTRVHRGIPRGTTLPIPLPEAGGDVVKSDAQAQAKVALGIPAESVLLLTVGTSYKYLAFGELDFIAVAEKILEQLPHAQIVAAGPKEDDRWRAARDRTDGRLRAVGSQSWAQIQAYHRAADVYLEGFPFGSTTALLEAALSGLPTVLAPASCPPPYATDGVALDDLLVRPGTIAAYQAEVIRLSNDPAAREVLGGKLRTAVAAHHVGNGWQEYLVGLDAKLPSQHEIYPPSTPPQIAQELQEYWADYHETWGMPTGTSLEWLMDQAFKVGLRLRLTPAVRRACREASELRAGRTLPTLVLSFLCNTLMPQLSADSAMETYWRFHRYCVPGCRSMRWAQAIWPRNCW